jgi:hypothetical protein
MKLYGVVCFVGGVAALATLVVRRNRGIAVAAFDYLLMFAGIAGAIAGLALIFVSGA